MGRPDHSSLRIQFIRAWTLKPLLRFLEDQGCPTERYLEKAHLSPDQLEDDHALIPAFFALDFADRASHAEGIDHLAARAACAMHPSDLGSLRLLLAASRNLYEFMHTARLCAQSIASHTEYRIRVEGDVVRFEYMEEGRERWMHGHLFSMALTIGTIQSLVGTSWRPEEVVLPGGTVSRLPEVSSAFEQARVVPGARGSSFLFPLAFLTLPTQSLGIQNGLEPGEALSSLRCANDRYAARQLVKSLVLNRQANARAGADATGMSLRTFQRRLCDHGLSFSALVREAKIEIAEERLLDGWPVSEIAQSLGYTDPANFTRAFRRSNGVPPRLFRQARSDGVSGFRSQAAG